MDKDGTQLDCVLKLLILIVLVSESTCWKYFTSLSDLTLSGSPLETEVVHSEYIFGDCKRQDIKFFVHIHKDHMDVLGKIMIRGWLNIRRMPTCILLRATSYESDMFRSTMFNFQICVPRISYCHTQKRHIYYFYEWYLPYDMIGGMNWDIYFYGPTTLEWQ